jgi:hypothetical protein
MHRICTPLTRFRFQLIDRYGNTASYAKQQIFQITNAVLFTVSPWVGDARVSVTLAFCCVVGETISINKRETAWFGA